MKLRNYFLLFIALHMFALGKCQKITEQQLKNELKQIQNDIGRTGIVNTTVQELEKSYRIAKENRYDVSFLIGAELMRTYSVLDNAEKVIEVSTDVVKYINERCPSEIVSNIYRTKAASLGELGFLEDSHKAYQLSKKHLKTIRDSNVRYYYSSIFYSNYSSYFDQSKKQSDSVRLCLLKGLSEAEKISDKSTEIPLQKKYDLILSIQANLTLYYLWIMKPSDPKTAEKYLLKSLETASSGKVNPLNKMNLYRTAGDFYIDQKDNDKAVYYAMEGLKLEKSLSSPFSREVLYEILTNGYLAQGNTAEGKKYSLLLTELKDSIKTAEKHSVNKVTHAIKKEKELEKNNTLKSYLYVFLVIIIVTGVGIWYYWKNRNKVLRQKFQELITSIKLEAEMPEPEKEKEEEETIKAPQTMAEETLNQLLSKLSRFEKSEKYLKNDLTIAGLASNLNTNTKYLSEIIKNYRNKNFNSYINGLRIKYITKKLYEEEIYRKYKISVLSELCGYATPRVFQNAFKNETGLTPSDFIENLKKETEAGKI